MEAPREKFVRSRKLTIMDIFTVTTIPMSTDTDTDTDMVIAIRIIMLMLMRIIITLLPFYPLHPLQRIQTLLHPQVPTRAELLPGQVSALARSRMTKLVMDLRLRNPSPSRFDVFGQDVPLLSPSTTQRHSWSTSVKITWARTRRLIGVYGELVVRSTVGEMAIVGRRLENPVWMATRTWITTTGMEVVDMDKAEAKVTDRTPLAREDESSSPARKF
jgi:hypothetical protein